MRIWQVAILACDVGHRKTELYAAAAAMPPKATYVAGDTDAHASEPGGDL